MFVTLEKDGTMQTYSWKDFKSEIYYNALKAFYNAIFENDKRTKKRKWDSVVFVSRKAYCLFLLLKSKGEIELNDTVVYSDRYVMKSMDEEIFKNQKICVVDDTVSTGRHIYDIYKMIMEHAHKSVEVYPMVFAAAYDYEDSEVVQKFKKSYNKSISSEVLWSANDILEFCSKETTILHQENIPYTMELPILVEKNRNSIFFTEEEFEKLTSTTEDWIFLSCDQTGIFDQKLLYGVMLMKNNSLAEFMSELIFQLCIRLQIVPKETGYEIVAIPFAVLRSVHFQELYELFQCIYRETPYARNMENYFAVHQEKDIYIALYRAVVYCFSYYFSIEWKKYILEKCGIEKEIVYLIQNDKYNFEEEFIESTKQIFEGECLDFLQKMIQYPKLSLVNVKESEALKKYVNGFINGKKTYIFSTLFVTGMIEEMRNIGTGAILPGIEANQKNKFLTIEEIMEFFNTIYPNEDEIEINREILKCACGMLGQSKLANEIYYDNDKRIIYRGFKYGENSEALLDLPSKIFYTAVKEYYEVCRNTENIRYIDNNEESIYRKNYQNFISVFKMFLIQNGLYGKVISGDMLKLYEEFFRERDKVSLEKKIMNKTFIAEDTKHPYYLEKLKRTIALSDIYQ